MKWLCRDVREIKCAVHTCKFAKNGLIYKYRKLGLRWKKRQRDRFRYTDETLGYRTEMS